MARGKRNCHLNLGPFCTKGKLFKNMSNEFLRAYITFVELSVPTIRQDADYVKSVYNEDYVEARKKIPIFKPDPNPASNKRGLYIFLGIAVFAVLVMSVLLLIVYLKRRKEDDRPVEENMEL
eukprot:TRINITY_DN12557_c0_g2_i2.p3 TRINITY_DN12557_c0_g2~~TRINITY_DN12557_c0_g2_i2.p3  ORF type:complete len:122 (-),score=32.12 TRINITY_DN12557_c0_g2_i2:201-566(-)